MSSPTPEQPDGTFSENPIKPPATKTAIPDEAYSYALDGLMMGHKPAQWSK